MSCRIAPSAASAASTHAFAKAASTSPTTHVPTEKPRLALHTTHYTRNSSATIIHTILHPVRTKVGQVNEYNLSPPSEVCVYVYVFMCVYAYVCVYVVCLLDDVGLDSD